MSIHDQGRPLLSIAVPIYNHADRFQRQLESLRTFAENKAEVEFVVVDDASTDDLQPVLNLFRAAGWLLRSSRQTENRGRAPALAKAIRSSRGRFVMIMDGDDTFCDQGLDHAIAVLRQRGDSCAGFVFSTQIEDSTGHLRVNSVPEGLRCTLLALRADHHISGDLKEVVRRDILIAALCPLFDSFRRVPTSLLWARVSDEIEVQCNATPLVRKVYLPGGMTKSLGTLRKSSVQPLIATYAHLAGSTAYRSFRYRWRALINYHRFLVWPHKRQSHVKPVWLGIPALIGLFYGVFEIALARLREPR